MSGYRLSLSSFEMMFRAASRHHRKGIASWFNLTAHTRRGEPFFRDADGTEIPLATVWRLSQVDAQIRRWAYNTYMYYR